MASRWRLYFRILALAMSFLCVIGVLCCHRELNQKWASVCFLGGIIAISMIALGIVAVAALLLT
ncbi:MAG TPA: hypothetical protein DEF45_03820 [Rhodopirellula sp.]|nr:hypothetical protein [Rhodopirellula sp.]